MLAPTALLRLHSSKRIYCICLICVPPPAQKMGRSMQVPCDTEFPAFISERTIKENTGHVDCDGCIKYDTPAQIPAHARGPRVRGAFFFFFYCNWLQKRKELWKLSHTVEFYLVKIFLSAYPSASLMRKNMLKSFVVRWAHFYPDSLSQTLAPLQQFEIRGIYGRGREVEEKGFL